ncbi:MAG: hypothetical protein JJU11_05595 [Candidatus Sumerlaeia bacterium]|nr:hypothetical protein [Candidatus Sumerlaeia bacterium]
MSPQILAGFLFLLWSGVLTWFCFRAMMGALLRDRASSAAEKEIYEKQLHRNLIAAAVAFGCGIVAIVITSLVMF